MYFYYNVSWKKSEKQLRNRNVFKCRGLVQMPLRGKKESADDKRGFLINGADSADRLCCDSSTWNHKYNEKKRQE